MAPIVRRGLPCRAECPINRPIYAGYRDHPLKRGRRRLVDPEWRGSMALVRVGGVEILRRRATRCRFWRALNGFFR